MRIRGSMYEGSTRLRKRNPVAFAIRAGEWVRDYVEIVQ
jgi:hypothetical protein